MQVEERSFMKIKNWKLYGVFFFCLLLAFAKKEALAVEKEENTEEKIEDLMPSTEEFLFEDGDIVGFLGDSITHVEYTGVSYQEFLYNYYITHYPNRQVTFRNLGIGSFTAKDVLDLYTGKSGVYDAEIEGITKAVIMLGMNEALTGVDAKDYLLNIRTLIELLQEKGLECEDIILVAPTPFDQTRTSNYQEDGQMNDHFDDQLSEYTSRLRILAERMGTHYIDLHTPMLWTTTLLQKEDGDATLTVDDNIHPSGMGNVMAGFFFLRQQGATNAVASVRISKDRDIITENAEIKKFKQRGERYIRFSYQPNSLPVAVPIEVEDADQYFGILDEISQEILQAEGLNWDKTYTIYMNHVPVGEYTGDELAQGVNLASCDWNPGQVAAKEVEVLNQEWHRISAEYRAVLGDAMDEEKSISQEDVDAAYLKWKEETKELQNQMYAKARSSVNSIRLVEIVSEDAHVWMGQELWQWAAEGIAVLGLLAALTILIKYKKRTVNKEN